MLDSYLKAIGFTGTPKANLETLSEIHRLHTLRFPFENLTPFLSQEVVLKTDVVHDKFILNSRGGYCFEQNLLFADMLKEIGFEIKRLGARVVWNQPEDLITRRSHMFLLIPIEGITYLADVGFGGLTLTTPIKFEVGLEQKTTHENFRVGRLEDDYKLEAKVNGIWKTLYRFDLTVHYPVDYEVANYFLYTNPESIFRNNLIVAKPVKGGRYALGNNQLTYYPLNQEPQKKLFTDWKEIKEALETIFELKVPQDELLETKLRQIIKA